MDFKKTLWILGIISIVLIAAIVGVALWALNKKQENAIKTQAARQNRWNPEPNGKATEQQTEELKTDAPNPTT